VGFERVDVVASRQVFEQYVTLAIVAPILMLGGGLAETLVGHAAATVLVFLYVWRTQRSLGLGHLSVDLSALGVLLRRGTPFLFMSFAMLVQPTVDAVFLSKLAPADVVGWHSTARRLVGFLIFPTSALASAMYPTLCRLYATDLSGFRRNVTKALRLTSVIAVPVALGCLLYPGLGVALFDRAAFRPAEDNLRALAIFVLMLYFTMPLGVSIVAAGRQRAWACTQLACVLLSVLLDPLLIPWFQRRIGNGGLGLCVGGVAGEVLVLLSSAALIPRGILDAAFFRSLLPVAASAVAMAAVAATLRTAPSLPSALAAVGAYAACLWLFGGIESDLIAELGEIFRRKLRVQAANGPRGESL
jgi:O-antigen/teichoic acid export membrane protein